MYTTSFWSADYPYEDLMVWHSAGLNIVLKKPINQIKSDIKWAIPKFRPWFLLFSILLVMDEEVEERLSN